MKISEILSEGYTQIWGRSKHGPVRRYRCTSGQKTGRIVSKPATCSSPINQKKSATFKKTRRARKAHQAVKRSITMRRPQYKRIVKINKGIRKKTR
jgi:hypothetical protein